MPSEEQKEQKPAIEDIPIKSSMEILSELFESFDAEPPVIIKKEKSSSPSPKKSKKSKKKHKHKDKKTKKKDKKKHRSRSNSTNRSELDLAHILIKQEKESTEQKIKIEGTGLEFNLDNIKKEKQQVKTEKVDVKKEKEEKEQSRTEKKKEERDRDKKPKLEIKLKTSTLDLIKSANTEEGEISDHSEKKKHKKRKHSKSDDNEKSKKRKKEKESEDTANPKFKDLRDKLDTNHKLDKKRDRSRNRDDRHKNSEVREKERDKEREHWTRDSDRRRDGHRSKVSDSHRSKDNDSHRSKDNDSHRSKDSRRKNPFYREDGDDFWLRDRPRSYYERERDKRRRERSSSKDSSSHIDKKKLLEIARRNAIHMMKSGGLPGALSLGRQAQEKVIAAIRAGGKTVEELTDFCKTLSTKEALGELSSNSDGNGSDSDPDRAFHHPFQIKDRPTSIIMNIKNSVPLPTKNTKEITGELRLQFPVSSGQLHRKTESEWVPVEPKKPEPAAPSKTFVPASAPLQTVPSPPKEEEKPATPVPQVLPKNTTDESVDIGAIVSERLTALRRLQENPNDVQALTQMYKSNKEMQSWAQSKQQPGQFLGSTGAQILSQAELSSGYQAWAKKDQLTTASPVSGGMGMHLLQKMGWKPGEGLGKEKTGALEPLLLEIKLDKKGLVATEEQKRKKRQGQSGWKANNLENKHPVSLLGEYASKRKLGAPQYDLCFECGPDHKKNFLFKVIVNGVEYKPNVASNNKKEAKAAAASICLQHLGLLPQSLAQQ